MSGVHDYQCICVYVWYVCGMSVCEVCVWYMSMGCGAHDCKYICVCVVCVWHVSMSVVCMYVGCGEYDCEYICVGMGYVLCLGIWSVCGMYMCGMWCVLMIT